MKKITKESIEKMIYDLKMRTGYNCSFENGQRVLGPPPFWKGPPPEQGSVVFASNLPNDCFEDELYTIFSQATEIFTIRIMLNTDGYNRGYAFISCCNADTATDAIAKLNHYEIRKGRYIALSKSYDNRKLYIGGIPKDKTKADAWHEVHKICPKFENIIMYLNPKDREKNRGFLLIEFDSYQTASAIRKKLLKNKVNLWGIPVQVNWAQQIHESSYSLTTKKLFIRNLPRKITAHRLYHLVLNFVKEKEAIKHIFITRHFASISFETREYAEIAKEGLSLYCSDGEMLEVHWGMPNLQKNSTSSDTINDELNTEMLNSYQEKLNEDGNEDTPHSKTEEILLEKIEIPLIEERNKKSKKQKKKKLQIPCDYTINNNNTEVEKITEPVGNYNIQQLEEQCNNISPSNNNNNSIFEGENNIPEEAGLKEINQKNDESEVISSNNIQPEYNNPYPLEYNYQNMLANNSVNIPPENISNDYQSAAQNIDYLENNYYKQENDQYYQNNIPYQNNNIGQCEYCKNCVCKYPKYEIPNQSINMEPNDNFNYISQNQEYNLPYAQNMNPQVAYNPPYEQIDTAGQPLQMVNYSPNNNYQYYGNEHGNSSAVFYPYNNMVQMPPQMYPNNPRYVCVMYPVPK